MNADNIYFVFKVKNKKGRYDFSDIPGIESIMRSNNELHCINDYAAYVQAKRIMGDKIPDAEISVVNMDTDDVYAQTFFEDI